MTAEQRTLMGYKSKVHEQGEFENPNIGKPQLSDTEEYVIRLTAFPRVKTFSQLKEKKDGTRSTIQVDKAICVFEEEMHHNQILAFFRVDSIHFSDDDYASAVVQFFRKIGAPLPENAEPEWDRHFITGMRFRGRVVVGKDAEKKPNGTYYLDVPTCRPLLQSDKHPDAVDAMKDQSVASVESIKLMIKGAKNKDEGMMLLVGTKQSVATIQQYLAAIANGEIVFPI